MADTKIDPYKLLGTPDTWGSFGSDEHDAEADAERRSLCDHFLRRIAKADKRNIPHEDALTSILTGSSVALASLMISSAGGPNGLKDDAFDHWIAIMTFAWHQAIGCFDAEVGHG